MNAQKPLIVVVDDDNDFLDWSCLVLEKEGYRFRGFIAASDALEEMPTEPPALIVTDLTMETQDAGLEFARQIRANPLFDPAPIILVSSSAMKTWARGNESLASLHLDAFLQKPIAPHTLITTIENLLHPGVVITS